jgi:hypothetical protein
LRGWLLGDFYYLHTDVPDKQPTREEQIKRLKQLREAATNLHSSINIFWDVWPLNLLGPDGPFATDDMTDQFTATLQLLADTAAGEIQKLASRKSRRGRPRKNEPFRQLTPRLVRKYKRLTNEPAGRPYSLPDSGSYGSRDSFYPFALAVWRCLRQSAHAFSAVCFSLIEEISEIARILQPGGKVCLAIVHPINSAGHFAQKVADAPFVGGELSSSVPLL